MVYKAITNLKDITAQRIRDASYLLQPRTYFEPEGTNLTQEDLKARGFIKDPYYSWSRACIIRGALENFVAVLNEKKERGILLIHRKGNPAKDKLWCIGGEHKKGFSIEEALKINAKNECGLNLSDLVCIGYTDVMWGTNSKETKVGTKGVHDSGPIYYSQGDGELKFKSLDNEPLIVTPEMWDKKQGELADLHYHVSNMLNLAMILVVDTFYKNNQFK